VISQAPTVVYQATACYASAPAVAQAESCYGSAPVVAQAESCYGGDLSYPTPAMYGAAPVRRAAPTSYFAYTSSYQSVYPAAVIAAPAYAAPTRRGLFGGLFGGRRASAGAYCVGGVCYPQ
jgi:hypothetical protein